MREQILEDLKAAMKARDKETLAVIRMVKAAIQMEELNVKHSLSDDEVITIISKQIKTRKESICEFEKASRDDLITKTQGEIEILKKYLPAPLSKEEAEKIIDEAFGKINPESIKDMGKLMKEISPKVKGKYDMSEISKLIKARLN